MIVSDGDDHTRRRASVQAAFSRRRLNGWIPTIVEQIDLMVDQSSNSLPHVQNGKLRAFAVTASKRLASRRFALARRRVARWRAWVCRTSPTSSA